MSRPNGKTQTLPQIISVVVKAHIFPEKEIFMCTYGLWMSCALNNKALQGFVLFVSFTWTFDSLLFSSRH